MIPSLFRARESAATFPGVERRSNLFHDEPRWLQETGNSKEEEEEEEEACVIKRYGEKERAGSTARSGLIRAS